MPKPVVVRAATIGDLPVVLHLIRADSLHAHDLPTSVTDEQHVAFEEISADPNQELLVAALGERVVATAQVTWMRMVHGPLHCQVEAVRTAADVRGCGIGVRLMGAVEDVARRRRATRIQLTSNRQREDAHRFYERLGYESTHVGMKKYL